MLQHCKEKCEFDQIQKFFSIIVFTCIYDTTIHCMSHYSLLISFSSYVISRKHGNPLVLFLKICLKIIHYNYDSISLFVILVV